MLDKLRLESYGLCCKMRVTTAVSILGWVGIIINSLGLMAGIALVSIFFLFSSDFNHAVIIIRYISGVPIILPLVLLILNILLLKKNSARSFIGVKNILRILCILCNVSLFLLLIVNYIVTPWIRMYSLWTKYPENSTPILISGILSTIIWVVVCITFFSLGIYGVRTNKKGLFNVFIICIFSMVLMVIYLTDAIVKAPYYYIIPNSTFKNTSYYSSS